MMTRLPLMLLLGLLGPGALFAQAQRRSVPGPQPPDPIENALFPPELVMEHQRDIGITTEQRTASSCWSSRGCRNPRRWHKWTACLRSSGRSSAPISRR